MNAVKEKLQELTDILKIEKRKTNRGLDSYFIINSENGLVAENQGVLGTQDSFHCTDPNITVGDSVESPKMKNTNTPPLLKTLLLDFLK